ETYTRIESHITNAQKFIKNHDIPAITIHYQDFKNDPKKREKNQ
ncbi:hypothetical protein LCGC14_1776890, partial [marine sediment metagenome]